MRIYSKPLEAVRETEREVWEMGISVRPQTMQDNIIKDDEMYTTKEIRGYSFKITGWQYDFDELMEVIRYFFPDDPEPVICYCLAEIEDRLCGISTNPGKSYLARPDIWNEFLHNKRFAYTYSERIAPQLDIILKELQTNPETRQGIINIHSNICPMEMNLHSWGTNLVEMSNDIANRGGGGRIPCSMYYQIMIREEKVDLIYTMRSCDLLTHFPVDITLALMMQNWFATKLDKPMGTFTFFCGSLHSYFKDIQARGIF